LKTIFKYITRRRIDDDEMKLSTLLAMEKILRI
jgi:hypothetical protein